MKNLSILLLAFICLGPFICSSAVKADEIPVKDTVTLVDLGADTCVPCKMMAPIIEKLKEDYAGKAAVLFIDVWKNPDQGKKFGVRAIPTQIIYDKTGKERYRHVGFWAEEDMKQWLDMLIKTDTGASSH